MNVEALVADLKQQSVRFWTEGERLKFAGPEGAITEDVLSKLRRNKAGILNYLTERSAGQHFADFDNPELDRQLNVRHPDADEFPEFAAALQLGRLVLCRRCRHYDGTFEKQLGWCRQHETEAAPDVPFRCEQHESQDGSAIG